MLGSRCASKPPDRVALTDGSRYNRLGFMRQKRHTAFALKAVDLARLYEQSLGGLLLEGTISFRSEMNRPDGPSTGGGVQAMQHLSLIPQDGAAALVFGHVNQFTRNAQLRTFDQVEAEYMARFKRPVPFTRSLYEGYIAYVRNFLEMQNLTVTMEPFSRASLKTPAVRKSGNLVGVVLVVLSLAIVGLGVTAAALYL